MNFFLLKNEMNNKILESSDVQMNNNEKSLKKINENSIFYKLKNFFTRFFNFIGKEKKENLSIEELNKASENLNKLEDKDIRIVYLPPMTIAAAYASRGGCEGRALDMISKFTNESGLLKIKPDARSFGFDCSDGAVEVGENSLAYEEWVSVPDDMEIPSPLVKRHFSGGLYAAHVLRSWDFSDWQRLKEWVDASEKYDNDWGSPQGESPEITFRQGFEETLNFYNYILKHNSEMSHLQLDLLFPIKEK